MKCKDCNVWGCQHRTSNAEQECVLQNIAGHIITQPSEGTKEFLVPEGSAITIDWQAFRREAANAAMSGMMANADFWESVWLENRVKGRCDYPSEIAHFAIACADELIRQLKQE